MGSNLKKITQKELMEMYIRTTRLHLEKLEECDKNNCSSGIHFFLNRDEAVVYSI